MISWLTNASKKRIIELLRGFMLEHPRYREDAKNVQNKYAFTERPGRGIIVDGVSADRVKLAADNYMGRLRSFGMLVSYNSKPNTTVEWVRENNNVLSQTDPTRRTFPVPEGVFLFKVTSLPDDANNVPGHVTVESIFDIFDEDLITFTDGGLFESTLAHSPVYPGSVNLYQGTKLLLNGVDYEVESDTGVVHFLKPGPIGFGITADYRYIGETRTEVPFYREKPDVDTIPGLIIAYGDRSQMDDEWAIVISHDRKETADMYGGKFEMSFNLVAFSKDAEDREKLSDYIVMKVLESQPRLGFEGFELLDINPGGENEEVFNPDTDEFFYDSSISLTLRVDWSFYIPLPIEIKRITATSKAVESSQGYLDGSYTLDNLRMLESSGIFSLGRTLTYERL
jgi:hypothetical protein